MIKGWGPLPAAPAGRDWPELMREALREAEQAALLGEIPVGALIVHGDGRILARAHNLVESKRDPTAHAEVLALRQAADVLGNHRLGHCFLVVTLEPCMMCAGAIREARLEGVVYGAADARAGAVESRLDGLDMELARVRPWHYGGVESQACVDVLQRFFQQLRKEHP